MLGLFSWLAAARAQPTNSFPLWTNGPPGALGNDAKDIPTLTPYLPEAEHSSHAAMIICPGGGYGMLANHEGEHYARFLNESGISGFVLKYRLGSAGYRHPAMLQDAARAMRTVRAHAKEWNIDPKKIGIMGSSAGGHLASTLLTHFDPGNANAEDPIERESSRPGLGILCYPVISMGPAGHEGSRRNLLGDNPPESLVQELSNELHVSKSTPPCFLWHTDDDEGVLVENTLLFAAALRKAGVHYEMHIYESGRHGLGLGTNNWDPSRRHPWTSECVRWLKVHDFAK